MPNVYYDVAHNQSSFKSLCHYITSLQGPKTLILALQQHKTLDGVVDLIENTFNEIIITQSNIRNYVPAIELAKLFSNNTNIIIDLKEAIRLYKNYSIDANIVIAGSHYLGPTISDEFKISFDNI